MTEKKVSEFSGRRPEAKKEPSRLAIEAQPVPGGDQGTYQREPCGSCIHWKKQDAQGLGMGTCMMMPPTALPVPGPNGQIVGVMNLRPGLRASDEGCDQHETEDEGDEGEDADAGEDPPNLLKAVGG